MNDFDKCLFNSLHTFEGAAERWSKRQTGLTNADLWEAIRQEYGHQGGFSAPGEKPGAYKGGMDPAFWYDNAIGSGKPTLQGKKLLNEVRRVMEIPYPSGQCECEGKNCYCPAKGLLILDGPWWEKLCKEKELPARPASKQLNLW